VSGTVHRHPDDNAFVPVLIGTIAWAVAAVTTWILRDSIGEPWWPITCLIAVVCGVGGLAYLRWRRWRISR
jgi:hypothetical protein